MLERYIRYDAEKNSVFMKIEGSFSVAVDIYTGKASILKDDFALALSYRKLEENHKALTSIVGETEWLKWGPALKECVRAVAGYMKPLKDFKIDFSITDDNRNYELSLAGVTNALAKVV